MKKLLGAGIITAIASSLCCITPLLALISGTTGFASSFSWLESFRPYLIWFTILVLGYAWYNKLKPKKVIACNCDTKKQSFLQSKLFLGLVTIFALFMTVFPYISSFSSADNKNTIILVNPNNLQTANLNINGMTCVNCEMNINKTVKKLDGIVSVNSSYKNGKTTVIFDKTKTDLKLIKKAINTTGYQINKK